MPQRTQHSLLYVLLLWTTILFITQVVFISIYFATGQHGVSRDSVTVAPDRTMQFQPNNAPSQFPSEHGLLLGKGKMLTFQAADGDAKRIKWLAKNPDTRPISDGEVLTVKKDGYYFLNLQVTLCSCEEEPLPTVSVKWNEEVLLQGWINRESCSTGPLGKVEELSAGGTLEVTINPRTCVNNTESVTHLDIIYMVKS